LTGRVRKGREGYGNARFGGQIRKKRRSSCLILLPPSETLKSNRKVRRYTEGGGTIRLGSYNIPKDV